MNKAIAAAVLLVSSLFIVGCGEQHYGSSYKVSIVGAGFSPEQIEEIAAAGDLWINAIPSLSMDTELVDACPEAAPGVVCIEAGALPKNIEGHTLRNSDDHAVITLDLTQLRVGLEVDAAHELGHAMGLEHTGAGTLMDATTGSIARTVTATDVAQFNSLRWCCTN